MFYNGKNNISEGILKYIKDNFEIDDVNSRVLMFYLNENIKSFIGSSEIDSKDVQISFINGHMIIKTIYGVTISVSVNAVADYILRIDGECRSVGFSQSERFAITNCGEKVTNECSFDNGESSYSYYVDLAKKEFSLAIGRKNTDFKEFVVNATPLGVKNADTSLYAIERVRPRPDVDNGSVLKKFVDLVSNGSLMNIALGGLNSANTIQMLDEVFGRLKEEIIEKKKRVQIIKKAN